MGRKKGQTMTIEIPNVGKLEVEQYNIDTPSFLIKINGTTVVSSEIDLSTETFLTHVWPEHTFKSEEKENDIQTFVYPAGFRSDMEEA